MNQQIPKYHRQRFLLFLLEITGRVSSPDFQKILFLFHKTTTLNYYDSIYHKDSYYSFQAIYDLEVLEKKGWVKSIKNDFLLYDTPYLGKGTRIKERWLLTQWIRHYKNSTGSFLENITNECNNFSHNILNEKPTLKEKNELFTIGYEGISLESYLTKLIKNNVNILYDVRKNPLSRKFGFSKGILSNALEKFEIEYRHIPALGIISKKRKNLNSKQDYKVLFDEYKKILPEKSIHLQELINTLNQGKNIALTCFEKKPKSCHRHCISDYLTNNSNFKVINL